MSTTNTPTNLAQIAWQLERIAMGDGYYGEALRAALAMSELEGKYPAMLTRYTEGSQNASDFIALQELAIHLKTLARTD